MLNITLIKSVLLAALLSLTTVAGAQTDLVVKAQLYNGVSFVSGGIGDQQQAAIKDLADEFNVNLVFAAGESGKYLADIIVRIYNAQGNLVLDALSKGPLFYAGLPAGEYTINVSGFGEIYQENITVKPDDQTKVVFTWPDKPAIM